jgi:hypothetical protein
MSSGDLERHSPECHSLALYKYVGPTRIVFRVDHSRTQERFVEIASVDNFLLCRYQETFNNMSKIRENFGVVPPKAQVNPEDLVIEFPQTELDRLRSLIAASRVGPETFEGLQPDRKYGIDAYWLQGAKDFWLDEFDW